ncbi:MAG: hypothetical protein PUB20_06975 [Clostridia bacterium]|nr:hypothetical protein [Clostridia bacterium]
MLKKFFNKIKYELCIFIFSLADILIFLPGKDDLDMWCFMTYLGDYSHGFTTRLLIGDIIHRFTDFVSLDMLYTLSVSACVLLCFLLAVVSGKVLRSADSSLLTAAKVILAFGLASPIFLPLFSSWLGLTDIWLVILTLVCFIFNENKYTRWLIIPLSIACCFIHQVYFFTYMTPLCIALLYDCLKSKKPLSRAILCAADYLLLIASGIFVLFGRKNISFSSPAEMAEYCLSKTDLPMEPEWLAQQLQYEYFKNLSSVMTDIASSNTVTDLLGLTVIFSPIIIFFALMWKNALKSCGNIKEKIVIMLCLIQPLSALPAYITATNWNRWTCGIIFSQVALALFMIYRRNEAVETSLKKYTAFFKNHPAIFITYFIFFVSFAKLLG